MPRHLHLDAPPQGTVWPAAAAHLGEVSRRPARQKVSEIEEGHLLPDHVQMLISRPQKYAVARVIGYMKFKSAVRLSRTYGERTWNIVGQNP